MCLAADQYTTLSKKEKQEKCNETNYWTISQEAAPLLGGALGLVYRNQPRQKSALLRVLDSQGKSFREPRVNQTLLHVAKVASRLHLLSGGFAICLRLSEELEILITTLIAVCSMSLCRSLTASGTLAVSQWELGKRDKCT